ncbi:MAG: hypothetical protein V9V01_00490 [Candidatus Shikimatogenerans sp. Tmey]
MILNIININEKIYIIYIIKKFYIFFYIKNTYFLLKNIKIYIKYIKIIYFYNIKKYNNFFFIIKIINNLLKIKIKKIKNEHIKKYILNKKIYIYNKKNIYNINILILNLIIKYLIKISN